jgi:hypothetical protein
MLMTDRLVAALLEEDVNILASANLRIGRDQVGPHLA